MSRASRSSALPNGGSSGEIVIKPDPHVKHEPRPAGQEQQPQPNGDIGDGGGVQPAENGPEEEEEVVLSAAERGLTLDTWIDRPVGSNVRQQLRILADEFKPLLEKIDFALETLRETAVSLAEAGLSSGDDEQVFDEIDTQFQQLVDERELVVLRHSALSDIVDALGAAGEMNGVQDRYRAECKEKEDAYLSKPPRHRFSKSEAYRTFREQVWESMHGSDAPMPPLATFFPAPEGEDESDSDDEIQVGGVAQTYKCPITLKTLEDPYTSTACPHSFSHAAILDYLEGGQKPCPVSGCAAYLSHAVLRPDPSLAKRVAADQRRREREHAANGAEDDIEELDDD